jgi:hypothetical protein
MAMFTAYFDASGHPVDGKVLTVAGFVSTVKKWARFEGEWNAILDSEGIKIFHMTDFVASHGEFSKGWKGQTDRRRLFIERLAACLKKNVNKSFRTTLLLDGYYAVNKAYEVQEMFGCPYALCCMICSFTLREWAARKGAERKLLYYFEDGDLGKGEFEMFHKAAYGAKPLFLEKARGVPLQAADFAGWKIRTSVQESIKSDHTLDKGIRLLESVAMLKTIPKTAGIISGKVLDRYCQHRRVKVRN